jgi:ribulose-bisphosphate carboxylase large chain
MKADFTTDYLDLSYKPGKKDLVCEYYIEPNRISIEEAANHVAAESSIGTWTDIITMDKALANRLKPSVFEVKGYVVKIAYHEELFEPGNMPQIWSAVAGNLFGMKDVKAIRLLDISFPAGLIRSFKGPAYGIPGIRKLSKVKRRPLVGTIIKPKVGLDEKGHAEVAYNAWIGGLDIVKDDENLTSMNFNSFRKRIIETLRMKHLAEKETGEKKFYMANVTAETLEMLRRVKFLEQHRNEYCMIDILTAGWSAVQTLRENTKLVIHAHRAGHAALTRNPTHGISMLTIAKTARLIGVDQLHIGTASIGKMSEGPSEALDIEKQIETERIAKHGQILSQNWGTIKPVLAVASGGLHPGSIPKLMGIMGKDIVMQFGGGCHGHPNGTLAGAKAIRQGVDACMKGESLNEYAKRRNHFELKAAIVKFGIE